VCGNDNCQNFHPGAEALADCCITPGVTTTTTTTASPSTCTGQPTDWDCCSSSSPCQAGQGDCDYDSDCAGSLVCGNDNCQNFHPGAEALADCCITPGVTTTTTTTASPSTCTGQPTDWDCCSSSSPCQAGQGDCDYDSDCVGSLVCGNDNCQNFHPGAEPLADCCITPGVTTTTTTTGSTQAPDSCNCGLAIRKSKIINGVDTEVNEYPWQVALVMSSSTFIFCGGSLINNKYVLTAAHCTAGKSASGLNVLLGEHDRTTTTETTTVRMSLSAIIDHPSYDSSTTDYDYSLLRLSSTIDWSSNSHIRPVCLPAVGTTYSAGDAFVVTGWGRTAAGGSASVLQEAVVNYVTNTDCEASYGTGRISSAMLCAAAPSKDSCQGDSGGPLAEARTNNNNYAIAGVVSWGRGCALPNYPGVYARVTEVLDWIKSNTGDAQYCPASS